MVGFVWAAFDKALLCLVSKDGFRFEIVQNEGEKTYPVLDCVKTL